MTERNEFGDSGAAVAGTSHFPVIAVRAESGDSGKIPEPSASLKDMEPSLPGRVKRSLIARVKPFLIGRVLYPKISINSDKFTMFFDKFP